MECKKQYIQVILIVLCALLLIGIFFIYKTDNRHSKDEGEPVSIAEASYVFGRLVKEQDWSFLEDKGEFLTYGDLEEIYTALNLYGNNLDKKDKNAYVDRTIFTAYVEKLITHLKLENCNQATIDVLAASEDTIYGVEGERYQSGLPDLEAYQYHRIHAYCHENEVLYIVSEELYTAELKNVWYISGQDGNSEVVVNNNHLILSHKKSMKEESGICDIDIRDGELKDIVSKTEMIGGITNTVSSEKIDIDNYGSIKLTKDFKIYKTYGTVEEGSISEIVVGYAMTDYVLEDGKICAAIIHSTPDMSHVRVIIKSDNYDSLFHHQLTVTADTDFTVEQNGESMKHVAGEMVVFKQDDELFKNGKVTVKTETGSGKIILPKLARSIEKPSYYGSMELKTVEGQLLVVNELSLEQYLYGVISSEVPYTFPMEALKAQAVCARSYAYNAVLHGSYSAYGAHMDDSTSFQVYGNHAENERTIQAVKETCGEVAKYEDNVIEAYYYSTSCGITSNASIWGQSVPYLKSITVNDSRENVQFTEEEFYNFIQSDSVEAFDSSVNWFRWKVKLSLSEIKQNIDSKLSARYQADREKILTYQNDAYVSVPVDTVGEIQNIVISKRGTSGIAEIMIIKGSVNTVKVVGEYNIRVLLGPCGRNCTRQDGSVVDTLQILPSAYVLVDPLYNEEGLCGFQMTGGGFGHGVGMSQNGACEMAEKGWGYQEILKFYYDGIQIEKLY